MLEVGMDTDLDIDVCMQCWLLCSLLAAVAIAAAAHYYLLLLLLFASCECGC